MNIDKISHEGLLLKDTSTPSVFASCKITGGGAFKGEAFLSARLQNSSKALFPELFSILISNTPRGGRGGNSSSPNCGSYPSVASESNPKVREILSLTPSVTDILKAIRGLSFCSVISVFLANGEGLTKLISPS